MKSTYDFTYILKYFKESGNDPLPTDKHWAVSFDRKISKMNFTEVSVTFSFGNV